MAVIKPTYHEYNKIELLRHLSSSSEELPKYLLTLGKLTTADVIGTVESHDTVDDEKAVFVGSEVEAETFQLFSLHLLSSAHCDTRVDCHFTSLF